LEPPFAGDNLITLGNAIANKKPKAIPHVYSSKFRNFVDVLLNKSPKQRPTALEAIKMIPAFVTKNKGDGTSKGMYSKGIKIDMKQISSVISPTSQ